jgi:hypothetical protein
MQNVIRPVCTFAQQTVHACQQYNMHMLLGQAQIRAKMGTFQNNSLGIVFNTTNLCAQDKLHMQQCHPTDTQPEIDIVENIRL